MDEKDPTHWTLGAWLLALCIPSAAGALNWYHKMKAGHTRVFNVVELVGEIFTSAFVGLLVFMGMSGLGYPMALCAACSGVGGHMATRLLFLVEKYLESKITKESE